MKNINRSTKAFFLTSLAAGLVACSHGPTVQEFADTASPNDEVAKLATEMNTALANQVNVLSPHNFKEAQESLQDAKKSLDKQHSAKDILHDVAQGHAYLNRASEFTQLAHINIEDVVIARQQALTAGAPELFAKDFRKADDSLIDVTSDIEKNELKEAVANRSPLQLRYLALELQAIKQAKLGPSREIIANAKKEGAKDFAPRSLAIAEKSVSDTDAFITGNRHDTAEITARTVKTRSSAEHLLKITRDSKSGKKTSSEELALRMENEQNKVVETQGQLSDTESQLAIKQIQLASGEKSMEILAAENASKQNELEKNESANLALTVENVKKQNELTKGETANQALTAQNASLESDQALNRRFEEARAEFNKSEAEVYKQGNTLMIRLRGLEFPVAQAVLKGSNFPLLAKVQKVIKRFGKSSVTVEGHTDSNGGKVLNERLSSERAQAVKEYLLSNAGDQPIHVTAMGFGDQKPLATNKTSSGRAQNRRVDILIQPDSEPNSSTN